MLAELLAHIARKGISGEQDDELRDMLATVVIVLRDIAETVEQTVLAWEKRNYWLKADRFRIQWEWAATEAERLSLLMKASDTEGATRALLPLLPKVSNIRIVRNKSDPALWRGALQRLLDE